MASTWWVLRAHSALLWVPLHANTLESPRFGIVHQKLDIVVAVALRIGQELFDPVMGKKELWQSPSMIA
jgi:hypothetical protein